MLKSHKKAKPKTLLLVLTALTGLAVTGSAAEVTPVRSVDKITVGAGRRGPVTEQIQSAFFGLFDGSTADDWGWLEPITESKGERSLAV